MPSLVDVLRQLGARPAERRADAPLVLDASALELESLFGGPLRGEVAIASQSSESIVFERPPELAACGTLWMPDVEDADTLREAVADAHATLGARLETDLRTLQNLGFEASLEAPRPRAIARYQDAGHELLIAIGVDGELAVVRIDDVDIDDHDGRAVAAPEEVDGAAARAAIARVLARLVERGQVFSADAVDVDMGAHLDGEPDGDERRPTTVTPRPAAGTAPLSEDERGAISAALNDDDLADDDDDDDAGAAAARDFDDADDTGAPTRAHRTLAPPRRGADVARDAPLEDDESDVFDDDERTRAGVQEPSRADDGGISLEMDVDVDDEPEPTQAVEAPARRVAEAHTRLDPESSVDADLAAHDAARAPATHAAAADDDDGGSLADAFDDEPPPTHAEDDDPEPPAPAAGVRADRGAGGAADGGADGSASGDEHGSGDDEDEPEPTVTAAAPGSSTQLGVPPKAARAPEPTASSLLDAFDDEDMGGAAGGAADDAPDAGDPASASTRGDDAAADDDDDDGAVAGSAAAASTRAADDDDDDDDDSARDDDGPATDSLLRPGARRARLDDARTTSLPRSLVSEPDDAAVASPSTPPTLPVEMRSPLAGAQGGAGTADEGVLDAGEGQAESSDPGAAGGDESGRRDAQAADDFDDDERTRTSATLDDGGEETGARPTVQTPLPPAVTAAWAKRLAQLDAQQPQSATMGDDDADADEADAAGAIGRPSAAQGADASAAEDARMPPPATVSTAPPPAVTRAPSGAVPDRDMAAEAAGFDDLDDFDEETLAARPDDQKTRAVFVEDALRQISTRAVSVPPLHQDATRGSGQALGTAEPQPSVDTDEDPGVLEARAAALEEEARALRDRAGVIRASRLPQPAAPGATEPPVQAAPPASPSVEAAALPSLASVDVEVLDEETLGSPAKGAQPPAPARAAAPKTPPPRSPPAPQTPSPRAGARMNPDDLFEGVSFAEVQRALREEAARDAQTQLASPQLGDLHEVSDSGDVFGNMDAEGAPQASAHAQAVSEDAPQPPVSKEAPRAVGLVVEDARARDRLKKRLQARIVELVEAADVHDVSALPELSELAAVVFVRPRTDERTMAGLHRLAALDARPRILVLSSDVSFDRVPAIDLRVALGERASEVAQQVFDGLVKLGVPLEKATEP